MLAPCTVTESNANCFWFTACITLKPGTSIDHTCIMLPDRSPAVTTAHLDPCTPHPTWLLTNMFKTHPVAAHPVCITLKPGTSADHACVTLPDHSPTVTTSHLTLCMPCPTLHITLMCLRPSLSLCIPIDMCESYGCL